ncbi:MAG TPA: MFS transporter [Pseudonocardiaceae bacterium]|nr:MFS transporter [Pseudonocardiaceae bacterium]
MTTENRLSNPLWTTVGLVVAVVAFAFQQTAVVPAVHDVQQALHGTAEWSSWLVTVYLMVATVATPTMGRLGDLHGRRRVLLAGLAAFAVASIGAACASNLATLLCWRAVQGVGGAVYPLALALARGGVPENRSRMTMSLLAGAFGAGTAIGFVGGGLLSQYVSWRAIFGVGAGLVLLAGWLALRVVPDSGERATGGFDVVGTVELAVAAVALLAGLTLVVPLGWRSPVTIELFVVTVALSAVWVRHERRTIDPLIDIGLLRDRRVAAANLATVGLGWALFGSFLLIPRFGRVDPAHAGYGLALGSALVGLVMLPLAVGQMVAGPLAGLLARRVPAAAVFSGGLVLVAGGLALLAATRTGAPLVAVWALVLGVGAGVALQAGSTVTTEVVSSDVAAVSAAVNSTVRRLAGGVGGQVDTVLLASIAGWRGYLVCYALAAGICVVGAGMAVSTGRRVVSG